jgi:Replication-relaxation
MLPNSYTAAHRYDGAIIQRQSCDHPDPCALRQRDLAIVRDVWRYHFLTTQQVRELWWPGKSIQAARRRLVKLFRAGYLERFRPYSPRGSYEWTYFLSARGHRLLRELGVIDPNARFKPREVFDYVAPSTTSNSTPGCSPTAGCSAPHYSTGAANTKSPRPGQHVRPSCASTTTRPSKASATRSHAP